jgi:type I restriction enzyme S subunit
MSTPAQARWPEVRIGDILTYLDQRIDLGDASEYVTITVKRRHGGLEERERVFGHQIKSRKQYRVIPGAFIISRIQCWHEAYAIVPDTAPPNMIASVNYDQFAISSNVDSRFFWWLSHSPQFRETVRNSAFGVVIEKMVFNREDWLNKRLSLPPLAEQQRIVARIEQLANKILEARQLNDQSQDEMELLCRSILAHDPKTRLTPMRELVLPRPPDVMVRPEENYQFAGVYSFGRGVFRADQKSGMEFAYKRLTRLHSGDFVYPKLMAWEGAFGIVPPECTGCVVSTEFPVFEVIQDRVLPEVLDTYFRTPTVWPGISDASTGTNVRRRRLNPEDFLSYCIPLPSHRTQERLRRVMTKMTPLTCLKRENAKNFDFLMTAILQKAFLGEL